MVSAVHSRSHPGLDKTEILVRRQFNVNGLRNICKDIVSACNVCQALKQRLGRVNGPMTALPVPNTIFEVLEIDFIQLPLVKDFNQIEFDFVMVAIDLLSGYVVLVPCSKKGLTSARVARFLLDYIILRFGAPQSIITDQDVRFASKGWDDVMKELGINHRMTLAYRSAGHGAVERANKAVVDILKADLPIPQRIGLLHCLWSNSL